MKIADGDKKELFVHSFKVNRDDLAEILNDPNVWQTLSQKGFSHILSAIASSEPHAE